MGVCDETNRFTCERCGSDRAGYFCNGCSLVVCICEDCPGCAKLPQGGKDIGQAEADAQAEYDTPHGMWEGYPC